MKNLPQSIDAEMALIGNIIGYPQALNSAIEADLGSGDFVMPSHQKIYQACEELHHDKVMIDLPSLVSWLQDHNELKNVGGIEYLNRIMDSSINAYNSEYYIRIIQEKAILRRLIATSQSIIEDAIDNGGETDDVLDLAESQILKVTHSRKTSDFQTSRQVVSNVISNLTHAMENKGELTGVSTGYRQLNYYTNGLQKGDLIILGARPSVGKTAFALNLGLNVAQINKVPVAIFSLEMPSEQLMTRMLSAKAMVDGMRLKSGKIKERELGHINEVATQMKELPIYIDDSSTIKVSEIFAKCRKLATEKGIGLIIIDYLQLITGSTRKGENRQQEVSEISRNLKALARDLKVPVIALSQLTRSVETRGGKDESKKPMLSDLRESGSIEQDADIVMFLYREDYYKKDEPVGDTVDVELIIAKHRNGSTGTVNLAFTKNFNAFYDKDEREES
ncbi:MAG: replicative DNA helicase [Erysipelotrichaceae bacterium]